MTINFSLKIYISYIHYICFFLNKTGKNMCEFQFQFIMRSLSFKLIGSVDSVMISKLQRHWFPIANFVELNDPHKCLFSFPIKGRSQCYASLHSNINDYLWSHDADKGLRNKILNHRKTTSIKQIHVFYSDAWLRSLSNVLPALQMFHVFRCSYSWQHSGS